MKFETKFNVGDRVWFMKDNHPVEVIISSINVFFVGTNQDHIKYSAENIADSKSWLDHQNLFEGKIFGSKKKLFISLFSGDVFCASQNGNAVNNENEQ